MYMIYALVDPRNDAIRYVGFTRNIEQRYHYHCILADRSSNTYEWIQELKELMFEPHLLTLEDGIDSKPGAWERETYWMNELLDAGEPLVNYVAPARRRIVA